MSAMQNHCAPSDDQRPMRLLLPARILSEFDVQISGNAVKQQTSCHLRRRTHPSSRPDDQTRSRLARPLPRDRWNDFQARTTHCDAREY